MRSRSNPRTTNALAQPYRVVQGHEGDLDALECGHYVPHRRDIKGGKRRCPHCPPEMKKRKASE